MDLINNRYRVMKKLSQVHMISSYLVTDIMKNHEILQLNIISSEYINDSLLDFYINKFIILANIDNQNLIKNLDFECIYLIDNKKLNTTQYYYSTEIFHSNMSLIDLVKKMNDNEVLQLFIQICQTINYLHVKGFIYSHINLKNIFIKTSETSYTFKLKDLATIELEKYNYFEDEGNTLPFIAPEILTNSSAASICSDIYSLGILLLILSKKNITEFMNLQLEIGKFKNIKENKLEKNTYYRSFFYPLWKVIKKMLNKNPAMRYQSITELIYEINLLINKNFISFNKASLEKLSFNTKLVGRNNELNKVTDCYKSICKFGNESKYIAIHGESGIGKTRFLREVKHICYLKNINVYFSFSLNGSNIYTNKALIEILRNIIVECDLELLRQYECELVKYIPDIGTNKYIAPSEPLNGDKEKLRLLNRILSFIKEFTKKKPIVFIIDNLHLADDFTIELFEYMYQSDIKNLLCIFSYSDMENFRSSNNEMYNNKFNDFIVNLSGNINALDIPLKTLNIEETEEMLRNILIMPSMLNISSLAVKIYWKTYGNPLFIEEIIKNLFLKKIIYIDENTGYWNSAYTNEDLPIPITIEQAVLNQINKLNYYSLEILNIISVFNISISLETIKELLNDTTSEIELALNEMIEKGILCKKVRDRIYVYEFSNKILKNLIYDRIDIETKQAKHEVASTIIEKSYEEDYQDELIYHLEMSGQKNKVIDYYISNSEKMKLLKNRLDSIKNLEKAISLIDEESMESKKIHLLITLGDMYIDDGNFSSAIDYYNNAEKIASKTLNYVFQVNALNKIAYAFLIRGNIEDSIKYIRNSELVLNKINYLEGLLECKYILAQIALIRTQYTTAYDICRTCIPMCIEEYTYIKGNFYITLGCIYKETSNAEEALHNYQEALQLFETINYTKGILNALNNIGEVYSSFYQNIDLAIDFFNKAKYISEKNGITSFETLSLINLAHSYFSVWNYKLSNQFYKEALEKATGIEYEKYIFYCYNYLCSISLKLTKYKTAYEYYLLAEKEQKDYPVRGKEIVLYYNIVSMLLFSFGDIENAEKFVLKSINIYNNDESKEDLDNKIRLKHLKLFKKSSPKFIEQIVNEIYEIIEKYTSATNKINTLFDTAIILYENNYKSLAIIVFETAKKIKYENTLDRINSKAFFLNAVLYNTSNTLKFLYSALEITNRENQLLLYWKVCNATGDYYLSRGNYFYAINYYFQACEIIKNLALQIPEDLRLNFVKVYGLLKPFNKLKIIQKQGDYSKLNVYENINKFDISNLYDLDKLFAYGEFKDVLTNENFIKSVKKIYSSSLPKGIRDIRDIIINFDMDYEHNLKMLTQYLASITLSTRALIIENICENDYHVLVSSNNNYELPDLSYIKEDFFSERKPIIISNSIFSTKNRTNKESALPCNLKAIMCIPITSHYKNLRFSKNSKGCLSKLSYIKGYLYLESERILNNFDQFSFKKCCELIPFINFILDGYQLKITSSIDKLTGTLTRKALDDSIAENIECYNKFSEPFSIIMLDLDYFKTINDRFGHQTGDLVLKEVCKIILDNIISNSLCGRYGGEEFIIVLPETETNAALKVAENIRKQVDSAKILQDKFPVTLSIGISSYPAHAQWKEDLIEKADQALYIAKQSGRNQCQCWNAEFSSKSKQTNKLTGILSGNAVQDYRNVSTIIEILELIKTTSTQSEKIYNFLGRVIEITEAQYGMLFTIKDDIITEKFNREKFNEEWIDEIAYNNKILNSVMTAKQGIYIIDWDEIRDYDSLTGIPEWYSIIVNPLINSGKLKGILYLKVPLKQKEFNYDDFNYVNTLATIANGLL